MLSRTEITGILNRLLAAEYDMVEACRSAIERLENAPHRDRVFELLATHRTRADSIAHILHDLCAGESGPDASRVQMGGEVPAGGDAEVLRVLQAHVDKTQDLYEDARAAGVLPEEVLDAIGTGLQDAQRWGRWLSGAASADRQSAKPASLR